MSLTLCVLLWPRLGEEHALVAYEDRVLQLLSDHGGKVLQRVRGDGTKGQPLEVQLLEFPTAEALDRYMSDERRTSRAAERDQAIARTDVIEVQVLQPSVR